MEDIGNLMHGFAVALTWKNLLFMLVGILLGVLIGVLPGLGGANGVAILLPLTFTMPPTSAIIMLSCIYWGALFGGAITSILFNIPGEPWSVATTFDGYPMAQQGRAGEALTAAFTSSFVGALFAVLLITFLAPLVAKFALKFGPPEFFAVQFLTFCSFVGMGREPPAKTIVVDDARLRARRGRPRHRDRHAAHDLRPDGAAAGLRLPGRGDRPVRPRRDPADDGGRPRVQGQAAAKIDPKVVLETWKTLPKYWMTSLRACLIGCWMGITPGGATPASFMSYGMAQRFSKDRRQVRRRPDRRRGRAGDRRARRRHQRAAADADARHSRARRRPRCCSAAC